jgi:UDP-4-amino-4,6-dideoxy-N-acetyl-beta-L-altrosamine transaminase
LNSILLKGSAMIPYGRQDITENDIQAVISVLKSDFLTCGPAIPAFEAALCNATSAKHAFAMNSATSALHVACLALGVGSGDVVWTSPNSFVASANCALYCGADVDFVDIDAKTYNLCAEALEEKLKSAKKLPKVVIPVAFAGQSADMEKIFALSKQYGFKIIEDASHAVGGKYKGKPIGSGDYADITIFSFHPVKIVTTGEGGAALTNDASLAEKIGLLRSHGITRDEKLMTQPSEGGWYYQQIDLGYNYRMTDIQAGLGVSQMRRLDEFIAKRHTVAAGYARILQNLPVSLPFQDKDGHSSLHLYPVVLNAPESRRAVFDHLRSNRVGVNVHYMPIYLQPYYEKLGFKRGYCPNAEAYYAGAISLPMYPNLTEEQQEQVAQVLSDALKSVQKQAA